MPQSKGFISLCRSNPVSILLVFRAEQSSLTDVPPMIWLLCFIALALLTSYIRRKRKVVSAEPQERAWDESANDDLFETAPIGYLEIHLKGIVRRVNRRECELRKLAQREMIGQYCWDLIPPNERQRYRDQVEKRLTGQTALLPYQHQYLRPDGAQVTVEIHEHKIENQHRLAVGLRLASVDVTERKKSEDLAYETAAELRALFQAFPDLFLRLDREGNVLDCRGGQSSDPFLSPDKFADQNLRDILPAGVVEQFGEAQDKVRKTGTLEVIEFKAEGRQG